MSLTTACRSYGVRNLTSVGDTLYVGLTNIDHGLQIWAMTK